MQHGRLAPTTSDTFQSEGGEAQSNPTASNATSKAEHDFRFPRRPLQRPHPEQEPSPAFEAPYNLDEIASNTGDKLDFSAVESVARKELLRGNIFPVWNEDVADLELESPDEMQKKDPLATQIWRLYTRVKKQLPNQERMENLAWRMMAMNLWKRKQDAARYVYVFYSAPRTGQISN
jgi:GATA-binding protein, other eukaryote